MLEVNTFSSSSSSIYLLIFLFYADARYHLKVILNMFLFSDKLCVLWASEILLILQRTPFLFVLIFIWQLCSLLFGVISSHIAITTWSCSHVHLSSNFTSPILWLQFFVCCLKSLVNPTLLMFPGASSGGGGGGVFVVTQLIEVIARGRGAC